MPRHGCLLIWVKPLNTLSQIMVIKTAGTLVTPKLLSPHTYWSLNHSPYSLALTLVMSFLRNLNWNSWSPPSLHVLCHHVPRHPNSMYWDVQPSLMYTYNCRGLLYPSISLTAHSQSHANTHWRIFNVYLESIPLFLCYYLITILLTRNTSWD